MTGTSLRVAFPAPRFAALTAVDPDRARGAARAILDHPSFDPADPPRPLEDVGEAIARLFAPVERFFDRISVNLPGGGGMLWLLLAVLVVVGAVVLAVRMTRWAPASVAGGAGSRGDPSKELERLEAAAEDARRSGDLRGEIRFRFQAGLLRLARAGDLPADASLTTGQVARALRSETFDRLARSFEEVVYGDRRSTPEDVEMSRKGWKDLLTGGPR